MFIQGSENQGRECGRLALEDVIGEADAKAGVLQSHFDGDSADVGVVEPGGLWPSTSRATTPECCGQWSL